MSFYNDASLIFLPSAGKDGKAYSMKPTDGSGDFTFSRGSNLTATRVDSNGLIEKGRENLLLQSNQFDTTWANSNTDETSGQSGYDGSTDAWLLERTAANGFINQSNASSGVLCFSIYLKSGSYNWAFLRLQDSAGYRGVYFDLENGTTGNVDSGIIDYNIEAIGTNGWYRCSLVLSNTLVRVLIYPSASNGGASLSGTGSIYIQDAQLEQGLVATDYIESGASTGKAGLLENEPRFDYSGGATCPSLLLEPSRTNYILKSEYLAGLSIKTGGYSFTTNDTTSPDGSVNSTKLQIDSTGQQYIGRSFTLAGDRVISAFVKYNNSATRFYLGSFTTTNDVANAVFDIENGTILSETTGSTNNKILEEAAIEDYGNGWYRCWVHISGTSGVTAFGVSDENQVNLIPQLSTTGINLHAWGFQVEAGSYPTSYIPNHSGGSVTRGADSSTSGTISNINEGVLFFEGSVLENNNTIKLIEFNDGSLSNVIQLYYRDSSGTQPRVYAIAKSGGTQVYGIGYDIPSGRGEDNNKVAFRFADNNFALFYNGTKVHSQTSGTISTNPKNQLMYETSVGAIPFRGNVKQTLVFGTALSDDDCITLTTL